MAVKGLEKFKEYFSEFKENYVIIGGTACSIILRDADIKPRATKDIDMILVVERITPEFGRQFWDFIREGDYEMRERKREEGKEPVPELFRFYKPRHDGFPYQIELLSKQPEVLSVPEGFHLTPIPVGEDVSSLSAILMDEDFYHFALAHSITEDDLHVADTIGLICLKMKAYLNLSEQEPPAHSSDIRKHMSDVFKLMASGNTADPVALSANMKKDAAAFVDKMEALMPNKPLQDSIQRNELFIRQVLDEIRRIFDL
ncbi:hypothetical protein [uncultured Bacteroides sp.]|uniref:hypothetical protein n=1 Tax=uncultured Bacteroides sp. TaxID=162156 RepID=UPI0025983BE1|nr:hypothetical protein [uncultured Bacteroides sp.]